MSDPIHIISLGAGVQSSTMALMAAKGEITPMPEFAVFADTGNEPQAVYDWLEKLKGLLPFPVKIAHRDLLRGDLYSNVFEWGHSQIPVFMMGDNGRSMGKRQCTSHWKIQPIIRKIREATNTQRKRLPEGFISLWKGISTDEVSRAKDDREPWIKSRFPLLENGMSRHQCKQWLASYGFCDVPKSACFFCPYRSDGQWAESRNQPDQWEKIVELDRKLNARGEYLHSSLKPIENVKLNDSDRGQLNMFNNECEGLCGV